MTVTIKDVASRAKVSTSAVSRTFTEGASVSEKMRKKVEKAARELGYTPNILARSLTTRRTKLIGLVSNNFDNPLFVQVFDLFTRRLQLRGLRPLLVNLTSEVDPQNSLKMLQQYSVDGVILTTSELPVAFSQAFKEAGIPIVHAFARLSGSPNAHSVSIDDRHCGGMVARLLVENGYKNIAFLGGPEEASVTRDRLGGFLEEAARHNRVRADHSFAGTHSFEAGRTEMLRLLKRPPAEAYFCGDDVLAIGAISAIRSSGLRVPDDIGIVGLDDMEMAAWDNINLTTVRQPIQRIVEGTIELIVTMLEDPDYQPESRLFPCEIVERGTLKRLR